MILSPELKPILRLVVYFPKKGTFFVRYLEAVDNLWRKNDNLNVQAMTFKTRLPDIADCKYYKKISLCHILGLKYF